MHVAFSSVIPRATERVIGFWITVERSWCTVPFGICDARNTSNPTAGSFNINPMLQHWFATFAILGSTSLLTIYQTFLNGHHLFNFTDEGKNASTNPIKAALGLHTLLSNTSHKTATKFHYGFNIRQTSNVFQRLLVSMPENSILRTNSFCFGSPKVNACMAIGSCLQRTWQNSMTWLSRNVKKSSPHSPLPSILQKKIPSRCSFALLPRAFKLLLTIK